MHKQPQPLRGHPTAARLPGRCHAHSAATSTPHWPKCSPEGNLCHVGREGELPGQQLGADLVQDHAVLALDALHGAAEERGWEGGGG